MPCKPLRQEQVPAGPLDVGDRGRPEGKSPARARVVPSRERISALPKGAYNLTTLSRAEKEVRTMPIYEYVCQKCKKRFELVRRIREVGRKAAACPKCASKKVERRWSRVSVETSRKS
jgi:putative FmdB family regulatory protein